jgi:hypothetical protein
VPRETSAQERIAEGGIRGIRYNYPADAKEGNELIPDLLFFARVSVLGLTVIISSAIFIDYAIHH